uniref:F-box domain-containing protein n=1 Tax=Kalanchoe fedtschenkoi TaxID=63787 RepID=A0A7N0ZZ67_KALFE
MMTKQNNTAAVSSNESSELLLLCGDLIREILLKLPIKTLLRFKQVSKTWLRMITGSSFISDHYSVAKSRQSGPSFFIVRIPINICDRDRVVSVITQISMEASKIRIDKNIPLRSRSQSQSCRVNGYPYPVMFTAGFGLYCAFESLSQRVALLNPGTRNSELLPPSPFCDRIHSDNLFCFGHVDYTEDGGFSYKVGLLSQHQVENSDSVLVHRLQLYSSSTDSWKLILTPEGSCCSWMANGVNLNGKYHILSYGYESSDDDEDDYAYYEYDCHIMTFDYSSETFGRIELPDVMGKAAGRSNLMINSFLTLDDDKLLVSCCSVEK